MNAALGRIFHAQGALLNSFPRVLAFYDALARVIKKVVRETIVSASSTAKVELAKKWLQAILLERDSEVWAYVCDRLQDFYAIEVTPHEAFTLRGECE